MLLKAPVLERIMKEIESELNALKTPAVGLMEKRVEALESIPGEND
jgi:hypothetical protein